MRLDLGYIWEVLPTLLGGFAVSLGLVAAAAILGTLIGLLACFGKLYGVGAINVLSRAYVMVMRGIPEIVLMFWIYYCGPLLFGVRPSGFSAAAISMGLYSGAMLAEVFRAGILAVDRGQHQAAHALGLPTFWIWWSIIGPQATRTMIPALLGILSLLIKVSGIASAIGVAELVYTANILGGQTYRYFDLFTTIGVIYFLFIFAISIAARRYEIRIRSTAQ